MGLYDFDKEYLKFLEKKTKEKLYASDKIRINYIKSEKFVYYPKAKRIIEKLNNLMNEPPRSRMPNLLLVGESNNGKTSIIKKFHDLNPPIEEIEAAQIPVVMVQAPPRPDIKALYNYIFMSLNIEVRKSETLSLQEEKIVYFFKVFKVRMLIIDEIHNILSGNFSKQREFMNAIKNLSNILKIPIVLAGIIEAVNAVSTDKQISSRFRPVYLERWSFNKNYIGLLLSLEKTLPLRKPSYIHKNMQLANKILTYSEGLIGEIVEIVNLMAINAIKTGKEKISEEDLKEIDYIPLSQSRDIIHLN
ncbi:MAG TPA: AAA family ATPase [Persephonella sp.]|uniref:Putative transposon, transposition helper protein C n=1 Tax=Persephonella marina (strain DSM 14350 / EX-H1) TaxID=123214 RepID=C0QQY8_PERMH|nr:MULTISPECIES: TniB family NTP-binding protein [Persephonella]ACO03729.1 putative transposon, transposition helper protein C [Persephonella marina EX-H1]HCB68833.1 AAA family ATPase [Persephonella sp.]